MTGYSKFVESRIAVGEHVVQFAVDGPLAITHPATCDTATCAVREAAETYLPEAVHHQPIVVELDGNGILRPSRAHWSDVVEDLLGQTLLPWQRRFLELWVAQPETKLTVDMGRRARSGATPLPAPRGRRAAHVIDNEAQHL